MRQLSPAGQQAVNDLAQRHGFSTGAVESMLDSVINGNGSMAQFNHFEFGGSGQWMQGGMTMIGDMFNNHLKGRVDNLCSDLSRLIYSQPELVRYGSFQSQSQNGSEQFNGSGNSHGDSPANPNSLFVAAPAQADWWGPDLRWPNSTGGQNGVRYAWFGQAGRLAIEANGHVTVYDTLDHQIGGVSQQQSGGFSVTFTSQYGYVDLTRLPVVSVDGVATMAPAAPQAPAFAPAFTPAFIPAAAPAYAPTGGNNPSESTIFDSIEKLAQLQARGILTNEEFATKKAELLSRL